MARPVGVMTVFGLLLAVGTGSWLNGLIGLMGKTGNPGNDADRGEAAAPLGDTSADLAPRTVDWVDTAGNVEADVGDAASGWAATASDFAAEPSPDFAVTASSDFAVPGSSDWAATPLVSSTTASSLPGFSFDFADAALALWATTAGFGEGASCWADAAMEIKEAAKAAPTVSKAERFKLIFSPKAEWIKKGNCGQHIVRCLA